VSYFFGASFADFVAGVCGYMEKASVVLGSGKGQGQADVVFECAGGENHFKVISSDFKVNSSDFKVISSDFKVISSAKKVVSR
jgi:hypothetical protein